MTAEHYRVASETKAALVRAGHAPDAAEAIVRRALARTPFCCGSCASGGECDGGLGRLQTRSLRRDLDPTIRPRPVQAGERCVRLQETPGDETPLWKALDEYRARGWNVYESRRTSGSPSVAVYWACPPGQLPLEGGLGAEPPPPTILADIAKVGNDPMVSAIRNAISPWLWVTSLIGFATGLLNTRRIAIMYRKHLAGRKKS
jgi:hypothetical protein